LVSGARFPLRPGAPTPQPPTRASTSTTANAALLAEITQNASPELQVLEEVPSSTRLICSPSFAIPKPNGKFRTIWDGRFVNAAFVRPPHFQMPSLATVRELLQPGELMIKIDLSNAYFHVPIHPAIAFFLGTAINGRRFRYRALPMGHSWSAWTFQRLLKPILRHLRRQGIRLLAYLDDWLIIGKTAAETLRHAQTTLELLVRLGFRPNWEKSVLTPTRSLTFLGFVIDSSTMTVAVPSTKITDVRHDLTTILRARDSFSPVPLRRLASTLGRLRALAAAVLPTALMTTATHHLITRLAHHGWRYPTFITRPVAMELRWWANGIDRFPRRPLSTTPTRMIRSDASERGWGAGIWRPGGNPSSFSSPRLLSQTRGYFSRADTAKSINWRETNAASHALGSFLDRVRGRAVLHQVDNTTAESYLRRQGGRHRHLAACARTYWIIALENDVNPTFSHVPGALNTIADRQSRMRPTRYDYRLRPSIFRRLDSLWGPFTLDAFATSASTHLERFCSQRAQPGSLGDVFPMTLTDELTYANPPPRLVGRFLHQLQVQRATACIIVQAFPTQPWWPMLPPMLADVPRWLPPQPFLAPPGFPPPFRRAQRRSLAMLVSGDPLTTARFRQRWHSDSPPPGTPPAAHTDAIALGIPL
jgi:hypothetical protein